jgi:branched-chain amino acid transport system ATP-binding protein
MTALLDCRDIQKKFNGRPVIDVNVSMEAGEVLGIIGANGAGKTTLVNIITGYVKPSAGRVVLAGEDITNLPPRRVTGKGVARSFQIPQLFRNMSSVENVMIALVLGSGGITAQLGSFANAKRRAEALDILRHFGISSYADELVATQPQGVRKLLDIAVAMCRAPRLVLLDEPTSGVSSSEKHKIMTMLWNAIAETRTGVLFIEHDMELVKHYAHRVIALYQGRIIANGRPEEVFRDEQVQLYVTGKAV